MDPTISQHSLTHSQSTDSIKMESAKPEDSSGDAKKVKSGLKNFMGAVHRWGITATGMLPCSSRGIPSILVKAPILIPARLAQSAGKGFSKKFKEHIKKDLGGGISDSYIDLRSPKNKELREKVLKENFRYASYVYMGYYHSVFSKKEGDEHATLVSLDKDGTLVDKGIKPIKHQDIPQAHRETLQKIATQFKELGFETDRCGNFYDTKTGTIFNLAFDHDRKEVAVSFWGVENEGKIAFDADDVRNKNTDKIRLELNRSAHASINADFLGGIPPASRQVMEIGKILKKETSGTGLTPVMIGHSHGGGLAQTGAAANGIKGVVFNPRPMGAGTRRYIGQSKIAENAQHITAFSVKGDWLSDSPGKNALAKFAERVIGIPVPRTVGTGYDLPSVRVINQSTGAISNGNPGTQHAQFHMAFIELRNIE